MNAKCFSAFYVALNAAIVKSEDYGCKHLTKMLEDTAKELLTNELKTFQHPDDLVINSEYSRIYNQTVPGLNEDEIKSLNNHQKIQAIKNYRERTGLGLLESKLAVETYMSKHNIVMPKPTYST